MGLDGATQSSATAPSPRQRPAAPGTAHRTGRLDPCPPLNPASLLHRVWVQQNKALMYLKGDLLLLGGKKKNVHFSTSFQLRKFHSQDSPSRIQKLQQLGKQEDENQIRHLREKRALELWQHLWVLATVLQNILHPQLFSQSEYMQSILKLQKLERVGHETADNAGNIWARKN